MVKQRQKHSLQFISGHACLYISDTFGLGSVRQKRAVESGRGRARAVCGLVTTNAAGHSCEPCRWRLYGRTIQSKRLSDAQWSASGEGTLIRTGVMGSDAYRSMWRSGILCKYTNYPLILATVVPGEIRFA